MKELQLACIFPFAPSFSLLRIIRLQSGLRGVSAHVSTRVQKTGGKTGCAAAPEISTCVPPPPTTSSLPSLFSAASARSSTRHGALRLTQFFPGAPPVLRVHKDCAVKAPGPCLSIILEIKQHLLCSGPSLLIRRRVCREPEMHLNSPVASHELSLMYFSHSWLCF